MTTEFSNSKRSGVSAFAVYQKSKLEDSDASIHPPMETAAAPKKMKKRKCGSGQNSLHEKVRSSKRRKRKIAAQKVLELRKKIRQRLEEVTDMETQNDAAEDEEATADGNAVKTKMLNGASDNDGNNTEKAKVVISDDDIDNDDVKDTPFFDLFEHDACGDSCTAACELFRLLICPFSVEKFFSDVWEKRPMVLRRHRPHYNNGWFSTEELDRILRECYLEYTTNIDLTSYENGVRRTHNPTGRAHPATVWEHFKEGCSVRLLNPQTFSKTIWLLNSTLQELFNSCMGANMYLTPAGSQGFAPHFDDIEAFVMQLEGKKHWKLYPPRSEEESLPRFSSSNFTEADIGEPMLEVTLEPGDLLYFPRGTIHQASTPPDTHSLHITLSTYQKNTWTDFFTKLLPATLDAAAAEDPIFRTGLPLDYLDYTGIINSDLDDTRRKEFFAKVSRLFSRLQEFIKVDTAADEMGIDHIHNCLPPCLTESAAANTVSGRGASWNTQDEDVAEGIQLTGDTQVRLVRHGVMRLAVENEGLVLHHSADNTRIYREKMSVGFEVQEDEAPGVEYLIQSYPNLVSIDSLPIENGSTQDKIDLCTTLYLQGLLLIN